MSSILENLLVGILGALGGRWFLHPSGRLGGSPFIGAVISLWILQLLTRSWARVHRARVIARESTGSGNDVTTLQEV